MSDLPAATKGKLRRLHRTRTPPPSPPTIRRERHEVPPVPADAESYSKNGYTVYDHGDMRWRFHHGKLTAWFLYRGDRDAGTLSWAEIWTDGR